MARRKDVVENVEVNETIQEVKNETVEEKSVKKERPKQLVLGNNDLVTIRNNTYGKLVIPVRSYGTDYTITLESFGDTDTLEARDVIHIRNSHKKLFENGWLVVDDVEHVKALRLDRLVKGIITEEDIEDFLEMDMDEMNRFVDGLNMKNKVILIDAIKDRIVNDELDSATVIMFLEKKLDISLNKQQLLEERM